MSLGEELVPTAANWSWRKLTYIGNGVRELLGYGSVHSGSGSVSARK